MNKLKKNIIYQYMLVSIVLVIATIYLWWGLGTINNWINSTMKPNFIVGFFCEVIPYMAEIILFIICAYWYYSRITKYIDEETKIQLEEQNQLFANLAHDLKNPMTSVIGLSRALQENIVIQEEQNQISNTITEKCKQMNKIIDLMLEYTKMESQVYKLNKEMIDIVHIVRHLAIQRYYEIEIKEMQLDIQLPSEKIMFEVDELEFTRAVDNIIVNAIKHNPRGTKIQIGLKKNNENLKIWVADSGDLIPPKIKSNIYKPFVCGDESRNINGSSGLGLPITKAIIEKHGGKIFIDESIYESTDEYKKSFVIFL